MAQLTGSERTHYVRNMFTRIAYRYDLMNRLMTGGQDIGWRKDTIRHLELEHGGQVLDAGTGTGDIALQIKRDHPTTRVVASDLTYEMVVVGKHRPGAGQIDWVIADALALPFREACFDAVVSGYLLRNVPNLDHSLAEQNRVLVNGGRFASLDTTPPQKNLLYPFIMIHLKVIIPTLGKLITGQTDAYRYLPESTGLFLKAETLAERLRQAGFTAVGFTRRMFGTMAIHWGKKV